MSARLVDRNLRGRVALARFAAAPERRISGSRQAAREFVFFVRHERSKARAGAVS